MSGASNLDKSRLISVVTERFASFRRLLANPDTGREALDEAFYRTGCVLAAAYVLFGVVLNYAKNFTSIEWSYFWIPMIYRSGLGFVSGDVMQSIRNLWILEGNSRVSGRGRYLSWLIVSMNAKLRIFLERFVPPHPSFSFIWIFNVVLAPILLFKLIERLSGKRATAWACVALYLMSPGFLSGITFQFLPGKPLAHFAVICALFLAALPPRSGGAQPAAISTRRRIALASVLFVACFLDETAWFAAVAVTILCAGIPRTWRQAATVLAGFAPLLFFWALLSVPIPGAPSTSFWRAAMFKNEMFRFGSFEFVRNAFYMLGGHFLSFPALHAATLWAASLFLAVFGLVLWLWSRDIEPAQKDLLRRTALLLAAYLLFHAITMSAGHQTIVTIWRTCFYYGSLTSLFLAMLFSVLLTSQSSSRGRGAAMIFFAAWMIALSVHFGGINDFWKRTMVKSALTDILDFPAGHGRNDSSGPSFRDVLSAWRQRNDPEALVRLRQEYPQSAYWLFNELDYLAAPDAAQLALRRLRVPGNIYVNNAIVAIAGGELDAARAFLDSSIAIDPSNPIAYFEAGYVHSLKGDLDHAIEQTEIAVKLDPNLIDARNNLGFFLLLKGRYPESVSQFQEALKRAPDNETARNNLALALSKIDVNSSAAHAQAGYDHFIRGDVDRAIEETHAALALDPNAVGARNNLGFYLLKKGRYRESVAQLEAVLKLDPQNQLARNNLALAQAQLKR